MAELMKAVGYRMSLPITDAESLVDLELPVPAPGAHDLLVRVRAVSVNPVDVKVRAGGDPGAEPKILGYDAAGVVEQVGSAVTLFRPGDEVWYAGSIARPGTNAELHLVDERIVGPKPVTLDFAEAAALPLTAITAWESLFDRLRLTAESTGTLLVMGGAGGVGSILVQLARKLTKLEIVATASRPESRQWALDQGAHRVVGHDELVAALPDGVDYVFSPHTKDMIDTYARIVRPYGAVVAIDEPAGLELLPLKSKSIAFHWELMFTAVLYGPADNAQHDLLAEVARLVDKGVLRTTLTTRFDGINAENLRKAHAVVESGSAIGKTVVAGF
ncbi:zinc-binding alcohol dehydrogenase family protein [Symbioplanes lichenis]|uniref:zinc-binding alcohol dehydrogenase family protein n=1 Tax=Symbioplanes lichenis TaxID=1629072 RepID=UPI002738A1ED|nr:zinc-binding alcohol dehydrogenase family protein [Actinoplanes lichenis]